MRLSLFLSLWATSAMAVNLYDPNGAAGGSTLSARDTSAVPLSPNHRPLEARQEMDLDLIDSLPDPTVAPTNTAGYNPTAAIAAVVAEISEDPLPQVVRRRSPHERRDVRVVTSTGYTDHVSLGNVAINAPLDCASKDTYMGVKIFTSGPFDTALCAAACSAQSAYNLKHPPSTGDPKTCQFYQTYSSYKNGVYQGQYCAMYTSAWDAKYATNKGQTRGTDKYTIQDSYTSTNATSDGVRKCLITCNNPYWGNNLSCGMAPSDSSGYCWCNKGIDGVGYCTADEIDGVGCTTNADCGAGGICMGGGVCALSQRVNACNPGLPKAL